ncbi:MAG TPA: hypothetical protein VMF91_13030 [Bryobacteraceae bacterium]|nr:hypothetical protein [Bryobacteraceae bacterium]
MLDAALGDSAFPIQQLQLGQTEQVARIIDRFLSTLLSDFVILAQKIGFDESILTNRPPPPPLTFN